MSTPAPANIAVLDRVRVGGSGFTIFQWQQQLIGFAQQVSHTSPEPVAAPVAIHPMDARRPVQVITPGASSMGTITLQLFELYGSRVWERLSGLAGTTDLVEIFEKISGSAEPITMTKIVKPPKLSGVQIPPYFETYMNCVITNLADGETIEIGSMEVLKQITIAYTEMVPSRSSGNLPASGLPS